MNYGRGKDSLRWLRTEPPTDRKIKAAFKHEETGHQCARAVRYDPLFKIWMDLTKGKPCAKPEYWAEYERTDRPVRPGQMKRYPVAQMGDKRRERFLKSQKDKS